MNYRHLGKQKTLALSVYPGVSLARARKKRDQARELRASGADPNAAKRDEQHAWVLVRFLKMRHTMTAVYVAGPVS